MSGAGARGTWLGVVLGVAVLTAWLWPFPYFEALNNPNENVRVYMTRAMVEHHQFAINPIVDDWGYVNDKAINEAGELFPGKAPGTSFLAVPAYWLLWTTAQALETEPSRRLTIAVCRLSASIVPVLVFLLAFARGLRRETPLASVRWMGVVALTLGSTMLPYGLLCTSHALIAACIFAGVLLVERHNETPAAVWPPLLSGFVLALAITLEYPAAIGVGLVALATTYRANDRVRWVLLNIAGGLPPMLLLMYFHWSAFGSPFENAYSNLENPEFRESVTPGFFGMERVQSDALFGTWLAPWNGLLWFMPWTLVPVLGLTVAARVRELRYAAVLTAIVLVAYTVFVSMVDNWRGGWTAGPRYIVPVVPFLAWYLTKLLVVTSRTRWSVAAFVTTGVLVAVSVFNCGLSAFVFPHYPEQVTNPIHEIGVFMLQQGFYPHTVGEIVFNLPAGMALIPLAIAAMIGVAVPVLVTERFDIVERASAIVLIGAGALFIVRLQAIPTSDDRDGLPWVRTTLVNLWEPRASDAQRALHGATLPDSIVGPARADALIDAARWAAFDGFDDVALTLWLSAQAAPRTADELAATGAPVEAETAPAPRAEWLRRRTPARAEDAEAGSAGSGPGPDDGSDRVPSRRRPRDDTDAGVLPTLGDPTRGRIEAPAVAPELDGAAPDDGATPDGRDDVGRGGVLNPFEEATGSGAAP